MNLRIATVATAALASLLLPAAPTVASASELTETSVTFQEPYGGCDEAWLYPGTAGFNQCATHDRINLRPCPEEDSNHCAWDSRCFGNGRGRSFVVLNGTVTYISHRVAHALHT